MESHGLGSLRFDRGTELFFAVMRGDQMNQVESDQVRVRRKWVPGRKLCPFFQPLPESVHQFNTHGDMTDEFCPEIVRHDKAFFRKAVFPEFARVVKKDAGQKKVAVQGRVDRRHGIARPHHLRDVFHQTAAPGVMVVPGACRSSQPISIFAEKQKR